MKIELAIGDITKDKVDVIVNAAHERMSGGGGVDGAIHRAAGPKMTGECLNLYGCPIGEARITSGYNLPAKYIIHTVGPTWRGGKHNEEKDLASCYRYSLELADMQGLKTITFPCISTGAFCFPIELAADIAISVVKEFGKKNKNIQVVKFMCFQESDYQVYLLKLGGTTIGV